MTKYTSHFKHNILTEYRRGNRKHSFSALAVAYGIKGGKQAIHYWHKQWDGTPESLERKWGGGRAPLLTPAQVQKHIITPIRKRNKKHMAISYPEMIESVEHHVGKKISLRSLQRYGKEQGGVREKSTIPSTLDGCILIYIILINLFPSPACARTHHIFPL